MQAERGTFLALALLTALLLSSLAIHRAQRSENGAVAKPDAAAEAAQAVKDAQAARDKLEKLMLELDDLDKQIEKAANGIDGAENDADRAAAKARLEQLRQEQHELKQRAIAARALADRGDRLKCVCVPRQCIDNPLADGCR